MPNKGPKKTHKKSYWGMLVQEINNQFDPNKATFFLLPRKNNQLHSSKQAKRSPPIYSNDFHKKKFYMTSKNNKRYQLAEPFTHIYLTQREAESIKAILEEKTIIAAAEKLKLSPRTIEFYFDNVKKKMNCRKKNEVLNLIKFYRLFENLE